MGNSAPVPSAGAISASDFAQCLGRYPSCIEAISASKGAKPGQKTLAELDQYRYGEALQLFGTTTSNGDAATQTEMGLDHVKTLVEWKLRHGKFRPTLMKLVSSNEPEALRETIREAIEDYRTSSDVPGAVGTLTKLRGIGPATASLLLAVHDQENVIFFADEAFYWLCCGGSKGPIKYNLKEYTELNERARALARRLGVKAVDVERVAFVLMRQDQDQDSETVAPTTGAEPQTDVSLSASGNGTKKQPAKRKTALVQDSEIAPGLRRSKRGKQA
ncbi:hypothetical protein B0T19DRAFT_49584 [Cercophora scortea]|uniref:Uncharacterized protein n=1 Tax=Cercophora scortea TaxID=314031 RepID=A0AAE0J4I2_9PEZI|nr:hypothetical protein B0T19DRAFT_49584 [Cercophora scortea]